jgi:phosphoglycolate phosphatase-like HAD superfamily hydrolase
MAECFLFDIDGTLADCSHRLHHIQASPKDWRTFFAECKGDFPIPHMVKLATVLCDADQEIVYVSGRSDECRDETVAWLIRNGLPESALYMRKAGDYRADDIVKGELLDQIIADDWQPVMAFDDRDRVVKMWRERGIPCAQVAAGDF